MDMHSGGDQKLKWGHIFIEAGKDKARTIFLNRFNRDSYNVTCQCCGDDYSVTEVDNSELAYYMGRNDALFVYADSIRPEERV